MNNEVIMGIDTSNYTTSVALMTVDGQLLANLKAPLPVKEGERGLRQSDALFFHVKNMPSIMDRAKEFLNGKKLVAVGVSERPRNVEGSYMPCFLGGVAAQKSILATTEAKGYSFSHQCGHIMAVIYGAERFDLFSKKFVAFHLSGGTTEMLEVRESGSAFSSQLIGGTEDLNAGQVIDRIGVYMGLSFPAGCELEKAALAYKGKVPRKKPKIKEYAFNLSGLENLAKKMYDDTNDKNLTAAFVFDYLSSVLEDVCNNYEANNGKTVFLFGGGVSSNSIIKNRLKSKFDVVFAEPGLSADNAVGIAALTYRAHNLEK
ncbi:MAG: peptidase M22 [Clostridia bacterium]|nr:peptidase M22 [Clostridia bacterium]